MKYIFSFIFLFVSTFGFSQHQCGFDDVSMMGLISNERINTKISNRDQIHTIPVVFHVVHLGEDIGVGTNLSDEQILDGLRILNEDFRKVEGSWGDGEGVDVEIEFCLAQRDPNGNPTSGINRIDGSVWDEYFQFGIKSNPSYLGYSEANLKTQTSWDRTSYMNVWIVSEINNNNAQGGIQGFAYLPQIGNVLDGIVILHNVIGSFGEVSPSYNMSRVLTHEVGHYLGLFHTFTSTNGCTENNCLTQGDLVCDTPPTTENNSCQLPSCTNAQIENYMDYTQQMCKNMFSQGQKERMRGVNGILHPERISLLDSQSCVPVEGLNLSLTLPQIVNECGTQPFKPVIEVVNLGTYPVYEFSVMCTIENTPYQVVKDCVLNNPLLPQNSVFIDFDYSSLGYGDYVVNFEILTEDIYTGDDFVSYEFSHQPSQEMTLIISADFIAEIGWELINQSTLEVIWSDFSYTLTTPQPVVDINCIQNGCYDFVIYDDYGDGMQFAGDFTLLDGSGNVLAYGEGNWGSNLAFPFCLEVEDLENCEDVNNNGICDFDEEVESTIEEPLDELNEILRIKKITTLDISGRIMEESQNYQPGIYILIIEYEDGSYESHKIFRWN